jgi:glutaredoxin
MSDIVKIYVATGCGHCDVVKKLVKEGKVKDKVELIDVAKPENAHFIEDLGLEQVPTAIKNGNTCELSVDEDKNELVIECN